MSTSPSPCQGEVVAPFSPAARYVPARCRRYVNHPGSALLRLGPHSRALAFIRGSNDNWQNPSRPHATPQRRNEPLVYTGAREGTVSTLLAHRKRRHSIVLLHPSSASLDHSSNVTRRRTPPKPFLNGDAREYRGAIMNSPSLSIYPHCPPTFTGARPSLKA